MPRITVVSPADGTPYRLDTFDPAQIAPWLAGILPLISGEPYLPPGTIEIRALWKPGSSGQPGRADWPPEPAEVRVLDIATRRRLVEDLAAVLGLRVAGQIVEAES